MPRTFEFSAGSKAASATGISAATITNVETVGATVIDFENGLWDGAVIQITLNNTSGSVTDDLRRNFYRAEQDAAREDVRHDTETRTPATVGEENWLATVYAADYPFGLFVGLVSEGAIDTYTCTVVGYRFKDQWSN